MLNFLAKLIYLKYKPKLLVVSGTAGKSLTIHIIKEFLKDKIKVFSSSYHKDHKKSILLTFILESNYNFFRNIIKAIGLILTRKDYPEILILEFGFEDPKVVDYWLRNLKIDYLIITSIGRIPAFSEVFAGPENIKKRKKLLVEKTKSDGYVIVNGDDISCLEVVEKSEARKIYFGFLEDCDFKAKDLELICNLETTPFLCGTSFQIESNYGKRKIFLRNLFGKGIVYSSLASIAFLINLGFTLEEICNFLEKYSGLKHRLNLLKSKNGYYILDDSLHLSEASFWQAIDIFEKIPAKRKILVLGDCLDSGKYSLDFHFDIGEHLTKICDFVITFGLRSKYTLDSMISYGFEKEKTKHFYHNQFHELLHFTESLLKPDDLILITGDKRLNLHKLVDFLA